MTAAASHPRPRDAGVTLVEILVVLALIGTLTGAAGLAIGRANPGSTPQSEATLLVARLNRAADEALLTAAPVAFVWTADGYHFVSRGATDWTAHPVQILAETHSLGPAIRFVGAGEEGGRYVVGPDLRPEAAAPLALELSAESALAGTGVTVRFDGAVAEVMP